ncbi:MAG: alpha-L-arabinofuranosidase [Ruminococcaceae bacterium]|nr:alpha-L-arabinofuranosidase [Oscillospiraceae bacterium]
MPKKAKIAVHPLYPIGKISPRLYGGFLEPIGTMVNGNMFNPKHPTADEQGFRKDWIEALKAAGIPSVRLPGGNFISGWDWKDSIGPKDQRKTHLDLAWFQYITNEVGHDEYLQWAEKVGFEPMYTINLGTGDINDAIYITEYTNHKGGTYWSDLRRKNGHEDPYGVKVWYLGNEADGPWQIGSWDKDPRGYGVRAHEVSKAMKWVDSTIETAVCVSSSPYLDHYPDWDRQVLEQCFEAVDYISLHHYHTVPLGELPTLLASSVYFEDYINTEIGLCDYIATKNRSNHKMKLSFDEYGNSMRPSKGYRYGITQEFNFQGSHHLKHDPREYILHDPDNMPVRNFNRPYGDIVDVATTASTMFTFLRHADRVEIGCMTGGLNSYAACNHDHVWNGTMYHFFQAMRKYGVGMSMRTGVECDTFDVPGYGADNFHFYDAREGLPFIETAAAYDEENGALNVFVLNRNWESDNEIELDAAGFAGYKFVEQIQLYSDDIMATNTYENPNAILPTVNADAKVVDGKVVANCKKLSFNVFRFEKA